MPMVVDRAAAEVATGAGQAGLAGVPARVPMLLAGTTPHLLTTLNTAQDNHQILPKGDLGPQASGQVSALGASLRRCGIPETTQLLHAALASVQRCHDSRNMIGRGLEQLLHRLGSERQVRYRPLGTRLTLTPTRATELVPPHWGRHGVVQL
jgi:hypothetical protein